MRSKLFIGVCLLLVQCSSSSDDPTVAPNETQTAPSRLIRDCGDVTENVTLETDLATDAASCLVVKANDVTIDGAGHRITAGTFAVQWVDQSGVTVKNVVSDQGLQIFGGEARRNVVADSMLGSVAIFRGDDNAVRNSMLGRLVIAGQGDDPAQRETVSGNVIEGTLTANEQKLVEIVTGTDGTLEDDGTFRCARGEHQITDNTISGTVVSSDPAAEPELLYFRCGTASTISGNRIQTAGRAAGILLRDGADDNRIENNDVSIGDANEGALLIQSGSSGFHHPRNNVVRGNTFRALHGRNFWLQANATRGNAFFENLFRSDSASSEAVRIADGTGVDTLFDHNTFYRGGPGSLVVFRDLGPGAHRFTNNIFAYAGATNGVFAFDHLQSFTGYTGDHNLFFNPNGAVTFGSSADSLCEWISGTGQDQGSTEGDPRFVDAANGNFGLGVTSAARCAGENGDDVGSVPSSDGALCPVPPGPACS